MKIKNILEKINRPEIKYIILLFLSTRCVLTLIGVFSRTLLERQYGKQYIWSQHLWLDIWGVWDTFWYMDIATSGYSLEGSNPLNKHQANYAFFPLYPMLMNIVGKMMGGKYYLAGIVLSNIFLIAASLFLYKLVNLSHSKPMALRAVKYLLLFPSAFILSGVFTESAYLAFVILCFYMARKGNWLIVGISGFCLSLTRSLGVFAILPLFYEYFKQKGFQYKKITLDLLLLLLIPFGLFLFGLYNYYLTGNFFAFAKIQSTWKRSLSNPLYLLFQGLYQGIFESNMRDLLEASITIICLLLLIVFYKKIDFSYFIFAMYSILVPLMTGLDSMPRLILPIFPIYIVLAQLTKSRKIDQLITISLGLIQGFLMVFWSCGFSLVV